MSTSTKRLNWVDQARGWSIFLVVYGHNFPVLESYIYSFHVPLFFFISGMFHKQESTLNSIKNRAKTLLIPYFFWAILLYLFWLIAGRKFGKSSLLDLSIWDNFIGIFYAQGGQEFMDWGIPLWFLPCLFLVYLIYGLIRKYVKKRLVIYVVTLLFICGLIWSKTELHLPWSFDVALVGLIFYQLGHHLKAFFSNLNNRKSFLFFLILMGLHLFAFYLNPSKIDMYRSIYGNPLLFVISGAAGSIAYILFFKMLPYFKVLSYFGQHSIVILATHIRTLTVIKFGLYLVLGTSVFAFTEWEKLGLTFLQLILIIPIIWVVYKHLPILDGKQKQ